MKIILDPQIFNEQKFGGISRYFTELYLALSQESSVDIECPLQYSENMHLKEAGLYQNYMNQVLNQRWLPKFIKKKILKKIKSINIKNTIKTLHQGDFDVFIPTYYSPYFLDSLNGKPFVLTVYDMIHEILPQYFTSANDFETVKNKKLLMEKATKIISISESTKRDIIKIYPHIDSRKIEIVYLSHSIKPKNVVELDLPKEYILFVGNRTIYKNFLFFLKAVAPILQSNPKLFLVCAGGNRIYSNEQKLIKELKLSQQVIQRNFEDYELSAYYSNAYCFVFASEYEGFGIPVLESMACGCPVVLANHSSFPEVAGDAGVYFELNNQDDLKQKVEKLVYDKQHRDIYISKGYEQVKKYSWQKTADECLKVFQKAAQE
jgi:glycosyltransferase involved in cell wall biosynthesis